MTLGCPSTVMFRGTLQNIIGTREMYSVIRDTAKNEKFKV